MKRITPVFLCFLMMTFAILIGCSGEIKEENVKLKEEVTRLQAEIDSLKSIISELQQTDNYYYQMGVNSRQNKKYEEAALKRGCDLELIT